MGFITFRFVEGFQGALLVYCRYCNNLTCIFVIGTDKSLIFLLSPNQGGTNEQEQQHLFHFHCTVDSNLCGDLLWLVLGAVLVECGGEESCGWSSLVIFTREGS